MAIKELIHGNEREVKDVFYLIALQGLNYLAPVIVLPYLMVVLGAEKFGCIGFALAVCQYLMILVDFGFNLSATKRIALAKDNQEELNKIFSATFYTKMLLLVISFIILSLIAYIPRFEVYRSALFVMFSTVIGNALLFVFFFQGLGEIRWISIVNCIAKLSILPLTFVFVKNPDDYLIAVFLQGFVSVVAAAISIGIIAKKRWVRLLAFNWNNCKNELHESLPLFLSNAATSVYTACFVIILGIFALPDEVGRYSATDRIMRALCFGILTPILQSFYPKVSTIAKNDWCKAFTLSKKILYVTITAMGIITAAMAISAPYIEDLLGQDYHGTENIFYAMASIPVFIGIGGVCGQLMLLAIGGDRYKKKFEHIYFVAALVSLFTILFLSPTYQAVGAAVAVLITELSVAIGMSIQSIKLKKEYRKFI